MLSSSEFAGGESSTVLRSLSDRGFEFVTKLMYLGELDAIFSVGRNRETTFILIESRGLGRNTDYSDGLEALLRGFADLDATIEDILIDSSETRRLPIDQRRLQAGSRAYPIHFRAVGDLADLRREITRASAATARSPDATGPGNPTKRLRLVLPEPEDLELFRIAAFLVRNRGALIKQSKQFVFHARPPAPNGGQTVTRKAIDEIDVTHIHDQMQSALYASLVITHGPDKVSCEETTSSGRPADIVVSLPDGYELCNRVGTASIS